MDITAQTPLVSTRDERELDGSTKVNPRPLVRKHRLATRIWHWVNVVAVFVMLGSGLMIFNAHPRLYWGEYGANFDPAWMEIGATPTTGYVRVGDTSVDTTGVLGRSTRDRISETRAFPAWATLPSDYDLALARRWHLAFAWVLGFGLLGFMVVSRINRHWQRDLSLTRAELAPAHIWRDVKDHARLRFARGEAARRYGILQKLTYILVIFVLTPLLIGTGLAMSPALNAAWPWMLDLFGGRQSARSLHFIACTGMVGFIVLHVALVLLTNPWNQMRGMVTGWFRLPAERVSSQETSAERV